MWLVTITTKDANQAWFIKRKYKKTAKKLAEKYNHLRGLKATVHEVPNPPRSRAAR